MPDQLIEEACVPFDIGLVLGGNVSVRAAARLGLKPGTLQSKMVKLGIARHRFVA